MTPSPCPQTDAVARAARHGRLTADPVLAAHARACARCGEHLWLDELFAADARALRAAAPPEDPRLIWLRARLKGRDERTHRATWAIRTIEKIGIATGGAAAVILGARTWPRLGLAETTGLAGGLTHPGDPLAVLALATALALAATAFDFYDRWSKA
ncbi:MAG: hypothetical protein AAF481_01940 [Acidobacteriota bacterium]